MVVGKQAFLICRDDLFSSGRGPIEPISGAKKIEPKQNTSERGLCRGFLNKRTGKVTVMGHLSLFMLDTWIQLPVKYPITTGVILLEFDCLQKSHLEIRSFSFLPLGVTVTSHLKNKKNKAPGYFFAFLFCTNFRHPKGAN